MNPITVKCYECGETFYEDDVDIKNVFEGDRVQDMVCFECPNCGQDAISDRRG